jgi:hypothetical protein
MSNNMSEAQALFGPGTEFFPDRFPCFNCDAVGAELVASADPSALSISVIHDVTPKEALAAMSGLGVPKEHECSAAAVAQLFESKRVLKVKGRPIRNSHRCIIDELEFVDGTKLYLGSSAYGATVYRISKPHSYVKELEHG